jgi:hypothetical protein
MIITTLLLPLGHIPFTSHSRIQIQIYWRGDNLQVVSPAGDSDTHGRRSLRNSLCFCSYSSCFSRSLDSIGSRSGETDWCFFLPKGTILDPKLCLSVGGSVLAMVVKLRGGQFRDGGVHVLAGCNFCWCIGPSYRVIFGSLMMASLVCIGTGFPPMIGIEGMKAMLLNPTCYSSSPL